MLRDKGAPVADTVSLVHGLDVRNDGFQLHDGFEPLWDIEADVGVETIEDNARAAQCAAGGISVAGSGAVHKVAVAEFYPAADELVICVEYELLLLVGIGNIVWSVAVCN